MKKTKLVLWRRRRPSPLVTVLLLVLGLIPLMDGAVLQSESCNSEALVFYRIRLQTSWSRQLFPKHYPEFRPPPQWSMTYGKGWVFVGSTGVCGTIGNCTFLCCKKIYIYLLKNAQIFILGNLVLNASVYKLHFSTKNFFLKKIMKLDHYHSDLL